jgi:catechol 2,3-dioxygenase-like lactoylglutathione lyase family enzyme
MSVELNHIIIPAKDKQTSAEFLAGILGIPVAPPWGPFIPIHVSNGVTLDYIDADDFHSHHCAFLVSEPEFDAIFSRLQETGITYYADPSYQRPGEINHLYGGRGVYFDDPNGHVMEVITQPYGDTPEV